MIIQPDIIAEISMLRTEAGGKSLPIPASRYGCVFLISGLAFDCRLLMDQLGHGIAPGDTAEIPIKFLNYDLARSHLAPDVRFNLWEMRTFADGKILQVCRTS